MLSLTPWSLAGALFSLWAFSRLVREYMLYSKIAHIPSVGPSSFIGSYFGLPRFVRDAKGMVAEGYQRYAGGTFRLATWTEWVVVVSDPELTSEISRAPEETLSFQEAVVESMSLRDTLGLQVSNDPYHYDVIRTTLTKNIAAGFEDVRDEIVHGFNDNIPVKKEWTEHVLMDALRQVVCRASNRFFVGLPLCRDPDYIKLNIEFTVDVFIAGQILALFPSFMRRYVKMIIGSKVDSSIARAVSHLEPLLREAFASEALHGKDWPERPNNLIYWLLPRAVTAERRRIRNMCEIILAVNFAAIHTTSSTLINAVYDLAVRPDLVSALREEAETIIELGGWTKEAMGKLSKMDSFLKESARLTGIGALGLKRLAVKDFVFSNGMVIPKGTYVATASYATHTDPANYPQQETMNAFMWSDLREEDGEHSTKDQLTNTKKDYQFFGHGRHACPGRFFAVNEVKAMLAHIILTYDFKMSNGERPQSEWFMEAPVPDATAKVQFRARTM